MQVFVASLLPVVLLCQFYIPLIRGAESGVVINKCSGTEISIQNLRIPQSLTSNFNSTTFKLKTYTLNCNIQQDLVYLYFNGSDDGTNSKGNSSGSRITTTTTTHLPPQILYVNGSNSGNTNDSSLLTYDSSENEHSDLSNRSPAFFTPDGILKTKNNDYFYPEEYCIESVTTEYISAKTCKINCNDKKTPCYPICCPLGEVIDIGAEGCQISGANRWTPFLYKDPRTALSKEEQIALQIRPHYQREILHCKSPITGEDDDMDMFTFRTISADYEKTPVRVLQDGRVQFIGAKRRWENLPDTPYCLSGLQNFGEGRYYSGLESDQLMFLCASVKPQPSLSMLYAVVMIISSIFLLLTAIVYFLLREKQNIHGWTMLSLVVSMFFWFVFLAIAHLMGIYSQPYFRGAFYCVGVGICAHFFFLSSFCWFSVINFDLWRTFRCLTPISERSKGIRRFTLSLIFAWGLPLIVICVGIVLEHEFPDNESEVIVPQYGMNNCFIDPSAQGVYLYYIIGVLWLINLVFITLTVITIYKFRESTRVVREKNSNQDSFKMFAKLFVIMGVGWVFEIISWALSGDRTPWYWVIFDMINLLKAVAIFIIFVCKRRILNQVELKYPALKKIVSPLKRISTLRGSSISDNNYDNNATTTRSTNVSAKIKLPSAIAPQPQTVSTVTLNNNAVTRKHSTVSVVNLEKLTYLK